MARSVGFSVASCAMVQCLVDGRALVGSSGLIGELVYFFISIDGHTTLSLETVINTSVESETSD